MTIKKSHNPLPSSKPRGPIHTSCQSRAGVKICSVEQVFTYISQSRAGVKLCSVKEVLWSKCFTHLHSKHYVQCEDEEDALIVVLEGNLVFESFVPKGK